MCRYGEGLKTRPLTELEKQQRDARDLELINQHAEELNRDALDGLEDQAPALGRRAGRVANPG